MSAEVERAREAYDQRQFTSKYTVMTHLSHVFGKLGISSRVVLAVAAFARSSPTDGRPRAS